MELRQTSASTNSLEGSSHQFASSSDSVCQCKMQQLLKLQQSMKNPLQTVVQYTQPQLASFYVHSYTACSHMDQIYVHPSH